MPDTNAVRAFLENSHLTLAERIAAFAANDIARFPHPLDDAAARKQARELLTSMGGAGWFAPIGEQDLRACCLIREALAVVSPLADAVFALQALGITPLLLAEHSELQAHLLPKALAGEVMAAFAMTEPGAGSDVAALATVATRDGDHYVLNGDKTFISNAGIADFYIVFASTDPTKGRKGISCFLIAADSSGLEFVGPQIMSESHPIGEIAFRDCRIPADCMLGSEGGGLKIGLATLDRLRATVGAAACGLAERALDEGLHHAVTRHQFGKALGEFQLVQAKLARMATDLTAARLLVYRAAFEKDHGADRVTVEASMAKSFATEAAQRIVDEAVQILGGRGVLANSPVDRLYRSVRALRIYEGTTEIQQLIIARHLLADVAPSEPSQTLDT
ncbi:MAG: acyl-CoA dehydrogenase family protein [Gemmatimonadales bacterium]